MVKREVQRQGGQLQIVLILPIGILSAKSAGKSFILDKAIIEVDINEYIIIISHHSSE